MKRQNAVSAHLRTNLPRDHSAAQTYSDTASFVISERRDRQSTLNEKNKSRHWLYYRGITQSFRLLQITVSLSPAIFVDRYRPEPHGEPAQTGPSGSRSEANPEPQRVALCPLAAKSRALCRRRRRAPEPRSHLLDRRRRRAGCPPRAACARYLPTPLPAQTDAIGPPDRICRSAAARPASAWERSSTITTATSLLPMKAACSPK
jgi:hypothetical protein